MNKICVIFNPAARGEKARRFREHLAALSSQCLCKPTYAAGAGQSLAAETVREGYDTIIAAGGDGTVNEVLNGIADVPEGLARTRLGVLPLGTINVFARELKMPRDFGSAWAALLRGQETRIDLARAEYTCDEKPRHRYFLQMAGAGWDSRAIELVDWELKKKFGPMAYVYAGLKAWAGVLPPITATMAGQRCEGQLVLIGNGRFYGGNWEVFPLADLRDGVLDVTVFPNLNWTRVLRGAGALLLKQLHQWGGVKHFKADTVELSCAGPMAFHVEGENVGQLPARFTVQRQALRVLVP